MKKPLPSPHLAFALLLALAGWQTVGAAETAGHIQTVVGSAKVFDATGKERDVKRGDEIRAGDRIVTGDQSLVQVKFTDGAYVSVRTNTDVALEQYKHDEKAPKESGAILKLARGALRSITGLIGAVNPDGYRVVTPTATIGIRGTDHEPVFIPAPKAGETSIGTPGTYDKVNSGATVIRATTGEINIRPGQTGFVPAVVTAAPTVLPKTPEFFKTLDPSREKSASNRGEQGRANAAIASDGRSLRGDTAKDGEKRESQGSSGARVGATALDGEGRRSLSTTGISSSGDGDKSSRAQGELPRISPMTAGAVSTERTIGGDSGGTARTLSPTSTTLTPLTASGDRALAPTPTIQTQSATTLSPTRTTISPTVSPTLSPSPSPTISPTITNTTIIKR